MELGTKIADVHYGPGCAVRSCRRMAVAGLCYCATCAVSVGANPPVRNRVAERRAREFYLEEIDAWRRGAKASVGRPADGERYALEMRENVKRLEAELAKLGAA